MVTVHPLPSTFAVPVRFLRLPGLTNSKCALSRATLRRRQGVLSRMTSSCLSGTDRLSADAFAVFQRHIHCYIFTRPLVDPASNFRCTNCTNLLADRRPNRPKPVQWMCNGCEAGNPRQSSKGGAAVLRGGARRNCERLLGLRAGGRRVRVLMA